MAASNNTAADNDAIATENITTTATVPATVGTITMGFDTGSLNGLSDFSTSHTIRRDMIDASSYMMQTWDGSKPFGSDDYQQSRGMYNRSMSNRSGYERETESRIRDLEYANSRHTIQINELKQTIQNQSDAMLLLAKAIDDLQTLEPLGDLE